ncbi:MAG: carboxylate--amine ligase [Proteobacteria bacterium]|nr:MAG: carboxylate--amine ligase [Pseudomonadota bacterium]
MRLAGEIVRLLLFSNTTGYQANAFREAAEQVGVPITLATDRCHVLDDPWGDRATPVKFREAQESARLVVEQSDELKFTGIVAIGDAPTLTAALTAAKLGLRYHPPAAVEACKNKWLARELFKGAGLQVPWYKRVPADENPRELVSQVPFPCVLKPLGLSASRGVIRANVGSEFVEAFHRIGELLKAADIRLQHEEATQWIQIESYIPGQEFALEGIVTTGVLKALALFDKPDPLEGPYFEETIYVAPSRLPYSVQQAIVATTQRAIAALGLTNGPVHAEMRLNDEGVWMLEVAARPIGGLCAKTLRFGEHGMPLEELIVRHALGEDIRQLEREECASGVMMIPIPQGGFYEGVKGVEQAERVRGVESVEITAKLQQKLLPLPEGASYLGFVFARGETPERVEQALREAHGCLRFQISSDIPVVK